MKNYLYSWIWKWHFIGGIFILPFVLLLSITGTIYLFKDNYEKSNVEQITRLEKSQVLQEVLSYQNQWNVVKGKWDKNVDAIVLPTSNEYATEFISGKFSHKSSFYVNPYTGEETGQVRVNETDMHTVRKLHGELLLGDFGTKLVELVASWMVVLIATGLYLFWPRERGWKGLITVRRKGSKRTLYRDLHSVTGFWASALLLLILAGGLPWTDVFGSGYKWVQSTTNSGYPSTWDSRNMQSVVEGDPLSLDVMINKAKNLNLEGQITIYLPKTSQSVFSVSNETNDFDQIKMIHFDQYSGKLIKSHAWADVGLMMRSRQWIMAFHQGELGAWNFAIILTTALALAFLCVAGLLSYLKRKRTGEWGTPSVSNNIKFGLPVLALIAVLGILLPLFGASVLIIFLGGLFFKGKKKKKQKYKHNYKRKPRTKQKSQSTTQSNNNKQTKPQQKKRPNQPRRKQKDSKK